MTSKEKRRRKLKEPKELLMFFPKDYSAVKVSKNKIIGTAQQLSDLEKNTWVNVDIGDQEPWKGLVIKTGQTRNELGRCEIAFLAFLHQHSGDKENIPLDDFFKQQKDTESDEDFCHEVEIKSMTKESKKKKTLKRITAKRPIRDDDDPAIIQNKKEKKLKREQARAQAMASRNQSIEILQSLHENIRMEETDESDNEIDVHSDMESEVVVTGTLPKQATQAESDKNKKRTKKIQEKVHPASEQPNKLVSIDATLESGVVCKLQEMFAKSMKGIHERFDTMEKGIQALTQQQKTTDKKLEDIMASKVLKSKTARPLNLVVSHSHSPTLIDGDGLVTRQPWKELSSPERVQSQSSPREQQSSPESDSKDDTGYIGHRKFGIKASLAIIKRAEEQAKGVPKSLAFNLLNILVDLKTQAESNISGQNGKKPLDKNILTAIQSHLATHFGWDEETTLKNWKKEPVNLQQRIADKCRNLNKKKAK